MPGEVHSGASPLNAKVGGDGVIPRYRNERPVYYAGEFGWYREAELRPFLEGRSFLFVTG